MSFTTEDETGKIGISSTDDMEYQDEPQSINDDSNTEYDSPTPRSLDHKPKKQKIFLKIKERIYRSY